MTGDEWVVEGKVGGASSSTVPTSTSPSHPLNTADLRLSPSAQWKKLGREQARIIGFGNGPNDHVVNITRTDKGNARFSVHQGNNLRVEIQ